MKENTKTLKNQVTIEKHGKMQQINPGLKTNKKIVFISTMFNFSDIFCIVYISINKYCIVYEKVKNKINTNVYMKKTDSR